MADVKLEEECCVENKQLVTASSSSLSEGSGSFTVKSPGICSPATTSPSHRHILLFYFFFPFFLFPVTHLMNVRSST